MYIKEKLRNMKNTYQSPVICLYEESFALKIPVAIACP